MWNILWGSPIFVLRLRKGGLNTGMANTRPNPSRFFLQTLRRWRLLKAASFSTFRLGKKTNTKGVFVRGEVEVAFFPRVRSLFVVHRNWNPKFKLSNFQRICHFLAGVEEISSRVRLQNDGFHYVYQQMKRYEIGINETIISLQNINAHCIF